MSELSNLLGDILNPLESGEKNNPFTQIRVGQVVKVYASAGAVDDASLADRYVGCVQVRWLDRLGPISGLTKTDGAQQVIPWSYPVFSNPLLKQPVSDTTQRVPVQVDSIGSSYGIYYVPSVGDLAVCGFRGPSLPVVLGWLPQNLNKQQMADGSPPLKSFGMVPTLVQGELDILSQQQADVYLDKAGAVQINNLVQPTASGNPPTSLSDIVTSQVPTTDQVNVTVGDSYVDATMAARVLSFNGKPVVYNVTHKSGATIQIDTEGSIAINSAKDLALNAGGDYIHAASSNYTIVVSGQNGSVTFALNNDGSMVLTDGVGSTVTLDGAGTIGVLSPNGTGVNIEDDNVQISTSQGTSIVVDQASQSVNVNAQNVVVNGGNIALGSAASHPVTVSDLLAAQYNALVAIFNAHTHVVTVPGGKAGPDVLGGVAVPTLTPTTPITPVQISSVTTIAE